VTAAVVRCLRFIAPGVPCPTPADGVIGIELYPFASLMQLRGLTNPLTRMILNMPVCEQHRAEFVIDDVLNPEALAVIVRELEHRTSVSVDPKATKISRVAFDDPDYLMLERQRHAAAAAVRQQDQKAGRMDTRRLTTHHDGHGLNEAITILSDPPDRSGAAHRYHLGIATTPNYTEQCGFIQFQQGPRKVLGSIPGATEAAVLAVLIDRLEGFQAGPYACPENAEQLEHLRAALALTKARADRRAAAGTLGTMQTDPPPQPRGDIDGSGNN
jgi:hypothetical protein